MGQFIEEYQQIKKEIPFTLRAGIRHLALSGLALKDKIAGIDQLLATPRVQFLYIHHSFRDELSQLDRLMKHLSVHHTFVSYSDAVEMVLENRIDRPCISISSDDGFKNNVLAAEILDNYDAKACFFINPGLIEESNFEKIEQHCKRKLHLPPIEFLDWNDVTRLIEKGHEIGGHTMYHDNMAEMSESALQEDLQATHQLISERCGKAFHFAFPYGRFGHFNELARRAVFEAGFVSCASAERGSHFNNPHLLTKDTLCIRRDHVILDWSISQIMYFIANNVRNKGRNGNLFPYARQ